jgi:DNA-binding protein H-NS
MANVNLDKMSLRDLIELESRVKKSIASARDREKTEIRAKALELIESSGFSAQELFGKGRPGRPAKSSNGNVAAKYQNPDNRSETWAGRGRKPNWLVAKLSKGANIEDFAV